ncbi:MAG: hypothetical protein SFW09_08325 [Hyphomicrobiaceae bacterium]|nr:hypothetical protein [Hyphomicrobiaceae bacterium]
MAEPLERQLETQVQGWSGVALPNEAARVLAAQLETVIRGFVALRGTLQFEDEPASFEAALQATKETRHE